MTSGGYHTSSGSKKQLASQEKKEMIQKG